MPFRSEAQRRYMWANHPDIARRWENEAKKASDYAPMPGKHPMQSPPKKMPGHMPTGMPKVNHKEKPERQ